MLWAFPDDASVLPGGVLTLRVSTSSAQFHVDFYRWGSTLNKMNDLGLASQIGDPAPFHPCNQDWSVDGVDETGQPLAGWRGYDFRIPADWPSGVYIAVFTELDQRGKPIGLPDPSTADGRDSKALFVVRSASPGASSSILYKLPLFTYHAYNATANPSASLYQLGIASVSIKRPGGGTGGTPWDAANYPDEYDPYVLGPPQSGSPRQTFAHWDAPFIAWLERDHVVEYFTDRDLHLHGGAYLSAYQLVLSVGHDEYWSDEMRTHLASFIASGGNVAFFSGNVAWKRISFRDAASTEFGIVGWSYQTGAPENTLTGVSYRNAGGQWTGGRPTVVGYTAQHSDYWFFNGSGAQEGNEFGAFYAGNPSDPAALVGYECDGALLNRNQLGKVCQLIRRMRMGLLRTS